MICLTSYNKLKVRESREHGLTVVIDWIYRWIHNGVVGAVLICNDEALQSDAHADQEIGIRQSNHMKQWVKLD